MYGSLIEKTLNEFKHRWNGHTIRQNRLSGCPSGVPDDLYSLPAVNGVYYNYSSYYIFISYCHAAVLPGAVKIAVNCKFYRAVKIVSGIHIARAYWLID